MCGGEESKLQTLSANLRRLNLTFVYALLNIDFEAKTK